MNSLSLRRDASDSSFVLDLHPKIRAISASHWLNATFLNSIFLGNRGLIAPTSLLLRSQESYVTLPIGGTLTALFDD
jgi:hypothetical protein